MTHRLFCPPERQWMILFSIIIPCDLFFNLEFYANLHHHHLPLSTLSTFFFSRRSKYMFV